MMIKLLQAVAKRARSELKAPKPSNQKSIRALIAVTVLVFSVPTFAGTICSKDVITKEGSQELDSELLYAMSEIISSKAFDPTKPFELTIKREQCVDTGGGDKLRLDKFYSLNGVPDPSSTPSEGDTNTMTQSGPDGTRSWTYTYLDGIWVLTGYSFLPKENVEAPEDP